MKELKKADESHIYFLSDHEDPLLEYVNIIIDKYRPTTEADLITGYDRPAQGYFLTRYFKNKTNQDIKLKDLEKDHIKEIILDMGYDFDKFRYLLLFIHDFSFGICVKGVELEDTPRIKIEKFLQKVFENFDSLDFSENNPDASAKFKNPLKLTLEIKGKHKLVLDDPNAIFYLVLSGINNLNEDYQNRLLEKYQLSFKREEGKLIRNNLSNSLQICYFATIFLSFFELIPPKNKRKKKDSLYSLNRKRLIAKLVYIVGLTDNIDFSEDSLDGLFKKYKDYDFSRMHNYFYT